MAKPTGLEKLLAEQEIRDLSYRYARGADRLDVEIFKSVFWDDGAFRQVMDNGIISQVAEGIIGGFMGTTFSRTQHLNCNILIDFVDADHADTEVYFQAYHLTSAELTAENIIPLVGESRFKELGHVDGNEYEIIVGGRYLDNVERRDGVWKIKSRRLIFDYSTVNHSATLPVGDGMTAFGEARMARDRGDPSYVR